ncbi:MAG: 50S ribosomal protein L30 [Spirochaetia bacterium]|jgi:large subunit ribosomal protein L30|nr:50S ribosomal protein L30 [Spirochaetia bacterium]
MAKKILVKQIKSIITESPKQRATMRALGLRRMNAVREHDDTPVIRGMLNKVHHLVEVKEIN